METSGRSEVVLVGGGHSHIQVLDAFAKDPPPCRVTLVVDTPIAVYSGMVPGFVAGQYRAEDLEIDPVALARRAGVEVIVQRAVSIDPEKREIRLTKHDPIPYDIASFDIGSTVAGLDLPGVREHALPTRPIGVFVGRVGALLDTVRQHDTTSPFRAVVVGGGAGGVELAFTLEQRLGENTAASVEVLLLDSGSQILSGYAKSLVNRVYRRAKERGIEIRGDHRIAGVEPGAVLPEEGDAIPYDALVWVTGAVSHSIFADSGLSTDHRGFVRIRPTLQFEHYDNLLACGDCGTLIDFPQTAKAGVYAVWQGPLVTENIHALLAGKPLRAYKPQGDFLALLNLGDGTALGTKWGRTVSGRWVMTLKDRIDRKFMRRFT